MFETLAHYGKPTTDRVKNRYSALLETRACIDLQLSLLFTDYLRDHWKEPLYMRSAGAYRHVLSHMSPVIWEDEIIVGSTSRYLKGAQLYPEYVEQFFNSITPPSFAATSEKKLRFRRGNTVHSYSLSPEEMNTLKKAAAFWKDKDWRALCMKHLEDTSHIVDDPGAPGGWIVIDYTMILHEGLDEIIRNLQETVKSQERAADQDCREKIFYYRGLILALQGIIAFAGKYAVEAERQAELCRGTNRSAELHEIARICKKVPRKAPETFREAIQAFWFVHVCLCLELNGRSTSPGRFDQYMNPFFENDLLGGRLSVTDALELLELFRIKCEQIITARPSGNGDFETSPMYQHITLAGSDDRDNPADTILSKFMLQARSHIHTRQPVMAVRWRDDLSDFFKRKVADCIKAAGWCPDIYHDKTGTQRFAEQARGRVQNYQNWEVCRDRTLNNGKQPDAITALFKTHHTMILDLLVKDAIMQAGGNALLDDAFRGTSFKKIVHEYAEILHRTVRETHLCLDDVFLSCNNTGIVHPLLGTLGKASRGEGSVFSRLSSYPANEIIIAHGLIDLAKTLSIIKKYVYDEAIFTVSEIRDAIASDFEGAETMRHKLIMASSKSNTLPFFEDALIELLDTWSALQDKNEKTIKPSLQRRFKLVKTTPVPAERPHSL